MKHPGCKELIERDEERYLDFLYCKKLFWESLGVSHIKETRKATFVAKATPYIRSVLPIWAYPAGRVIAIILWDFMSLNFTKEALKEARRVG